MLVMSITKINFKVYLLKLAFIYLLFKIFF